MIDPRTLRPLDLDTILESVRKTNRAVIVEEGWPHGGVGANLAALIQEQAFDYLDAPVERVTGADVHMPYSKRMEQAAIPHAENVVSAALADAGGEPLMAEIVMPRLSDSMEEGTVLRWLKSVGDEVAVGDELVEIETDKANMVYESDLAGTLVEILAQEGDTLPVGDPIARVGDASEVVRTGRRGDAGAAPPQEAGRRRLDGATPGAAPRNRAGARPRPPPRRSRDSLPGRGRRRRPRQGVSDRQADRRAIAGSTCTGLSGSGPGGRIVKADVEQALAAGVAHRRRARRRRLRAAGGSGRPDSRRRREARDRQGPGRGRRAHQAPADGRPPHGGVEGDRAALLPAGRDRHDRGRRGPREAEGARRRRATSCRPSTTWW